LIKSAFADDKLNPRMSFFWKKQPQIKIAGWLPKDMELNQEILSNMLYIYVGIALLIEIGIIDSGIISSSQPISTLLKFLALNVGFMLGASTLLYVGESIIDRVASEISCEKGLKTNISSLRF
jgi:hypothetical protein